MAPRLLAMSLTFATVLAICTALPIGNFAQHQQPQQQGMVGADPTAYPLGSFGVKDKGPWSDLKGKHPNLALALELGIFFKAVEEFKDEFGDILERHDGALEGFKDHGENFLPPKEEFFVSIHNGSFYVGDEHMLTKKDSCHKLYLSGTNKYELVEAGAGAPFLFDGQMVEKGLTGPEVVRRVMHDAVKEGLNFIRLNAFAVDNEFSVITSGSIPYAVNENMLRGLDYVLDQARQYHLRVILVFTDYFRDSAGGPLQYLKLANPDLYNNPDLTNNDRKALFYEDPASQALFQWYIATIVNRVNTINGRVYKNDPTILGWDIMNEPRCESEACGAGAVSVVDFVQETYNYLISLGVPQPITVGTEGFYTDLTNVQSNIYPTDGGLNPYNGAQNTGPDFVALCSIVDFCEFNVYPDLWNQQNEGWIDAWIAGHAANTITLGKPLIVKEQGMQPTVNRTTFYNIIYTSDYDQVVADKPLEGGLKGAAFWQAFAKGTKAVWYTLANGGRFGIYNDDPEVRSIKRFSEQMKDLTKPAVKCPVKNVTTGVILPSPKCKFGYEGPDCLDINECVRGTNACDKHAGCINTEGGYECECWDGYIGTGKVCVPNLVKLNRIVDSYYTNNTLSCITGATIVPYPVGAPGFVYDPTGYFDNPANNLVNANRVNVTVTECKIACSMAEGCTSFYYDSGFSKCLLYANQCPYTSSNVPGCQDCGAKPCGSPNVTPCTWYDFSSTPPNAPVEKVIPECGVAVTYFLSGAELPTGCAPPPST